MTSFRLDAGIRAEGSHSAAVADVVEGESGARSTSTSQSSAPAASASGLIHLSTAPITCNTRLWRQ
jgi:hypothetical protein